MTRAATLARAGPGWRPRDRAPLRGRVVLAGGLMSALLLRDSPESAAICGGILPESPAARQMGNGVARVEPVFAFVRRGCASSAAPIAPPRSPSPATRTAGGRVSLNRCGCISVAIRSAIGWPKRTPSPPPMTTASTSSRLTADAMPAPRALTARSISSVASGSSMLERVGPDGARQPRAAALLHQLEQVGLGALVDLAPGLEPPSPPAPRRPPCSRAGRTGSGRRRADDHVADLAGAAASQPRLAVEDQPAADAGAPEHAEHRVVWLAGAQLELRLGGHLDVVAEVDGGAEARSRARRQLERFRPIRQVARVGDRAGALVDVARRADTDPGQRRRSRRRPPPPPPASPPPSARRLPAGRPRSGSAGAPGPSTLLLGVDDDRLDLGSAEIDSSPQRRSSPPWLGA